MRRLLWWTIYAATLAATLWTGLNAAPTPFPRPARTRALTRASLVGKWVGEWGGCRWAVIDLNADGTYRAPWGDNTVYVGSWGIEHRHGKVLLWITETSTPENPQSWQHYGVEIQRDTWTLTEVVNGLYRDTKVHGISGLTVEGAKGIVVRLRRP